MPHPQTSDCDSFYRIFRQNIYHYWRPIWGFDVVRFDEEVVKPRDGESCADAIKRQWGQKATDLIRSLIAMN